MGVLQRIKETGGLGYARVVVVLLFGALGAYLFTEAADGILTALVRSMGGSQEFASTDRPSSAPITVFGALLGLFIGALVINVFERLGRRWDRMHSGDKVNIFLGVFLGFIAAIPFLLLFNSLRVNGLYVPFLIVGLTLGFSSVAIYALSSMEEVLPWTMGNAKGRRRGVKILDTNVIIDGRIADVVKTGFLEGELYVPQFVLEELQHIADHHDALRRQRGRRGLEVLRHLQADYPLEVGTYDRHASDKSEAVDSRIVRIAKAIGGDIVTNDWNLNRVAKLQDITVLNLNDLALAMKPNVLPSETLELMITREGNQVGQGVGYLDDGTMVVVENGRAFMGESVEVRVTQVIQTERGKMIFAEVAGAQTIEFPHPQQGKKRRSE